MAISQGRALDTLLASLERLERVREEIKQQLDQVEEEIRMSTFERPTAQRVQSSWSRLIDVWEVASDGERSEIMRSLVQEVVVHEKSRVSLVLTANPEVHGSKFVITEEMGAGRGFEPLTFGL